MVGLVQSSGDDLACFLLFIANIISPGRFVPRRVDNTQISPIGHFSQYSRTVYSHVTLEYLVDNLDRIALLVTEPPPMLTQRRCKIHLFANPKLYITLTFETT